MIAPLYDNKGTVRYFIGAQIDINGLLEQGRGLDSFSRLLTEDRVAARYGGRQAPPKAPQTALAEMCAVLSEAEAVIVRGSVGREIESAESGSSTPRLSAGGMMGAQRAPRRYVGMDDPMDKELWPAAHLGSSGRLPGVFQNVSYPPTALFLPFLRPSSPPSRISHQSNRSSNLESTCSYAPTLLSA